MMKNAQVLEKAQTLKMPFLVIWVFCVFGALMVVPYVRYLGLLPPTLSIAYTLLIIAVQAMLFSGLVCYLSYLIISKTDLDPFPVRPFLSRVFYPGLIAGAACGLCIYGLDHAFFKNSLLLKSHPPAWTGFLASFYGAINEEVLLRLFFFSFLYFVFKKIFCFAAKDRPIVLWLTNAITALLFGLGHLPAAFQLIPPSSFEICRILLLNGLPGLIFGWLYWSKGLWSAMMAHFTTDLLIHIFLL